MDSKVFHAFHIKILFQIRTPFNFIFFLNCFFSVCSADQASTSSLAQITFSNTLLYTICSQKANFDETNEIEPPIRSKAAVAARLQYQPDANDCGWFTWSRCDGDICPPFSYTSCNQSTKIRESNKTAKTHAAGSANVGPKSTSFKDPFTSLVVIKNKGVHLCSGVIISKNWVITAAHCILSPLPSMYRIFAGDRDKKLPESSEQEVAAYNIFVHENFNDSTLENDIALIQLSNEFIFNQQVQPALLPESFALPTDNLTFVGWVEPIGGPVLSKNKLESAFGTSLNFNECKGNFPQNMVEDTLFCAQPFEPVGCFGESGGPVFYTTDSNKLILAGVNSWDMGCAMTKLPAIYTNVSQYVTWIQNKTSSPENEGGVMQSRIVGGSGSLPHKYPSLLLLMVDGEHMCSATILNKDWIITAAHCVISENPSSYTFVAAEHNKRSYEGFEVEVKATKIFKHPNYNTVTTENDITLMKISPSFNFSHIIQPVNLVNPNYKPSGKFWVAGWGASDEKGDADESPSKLQELDVPIVDIEICKTRLKPNEVNDKSNICAGYPEGGRDSCQGDSGGPLYFVSARQHYLAGVISWGVGCARKSKPGVYTNVAHYIKWIKSTMGGPAKRKSLASGKNAKISVRVVGGRTAQAYKYKPIVLLKIRGAHKCSGSILNTEWVVSAAHCILALTPEDYQFVAAEHDKSKHEGEEQTVTATTIIRHNYNSTTEANDIVLFKVAPPFVFNDNVQPVVLPVKDYQPKGDLWLAGWGLTAEGATFTPSLLKHVSLPVIDQATCREQLPDDTITDGMICAGYKKGGKDACRGDSGGPLFDLTDGIFTLVGIVSWSRGCAHAEIPGVYTRVSYYLDWIKENTESSVDIKFIKGHKSTTQTPADSNESSDEDEFISFKVH